MAFLTTGGTGDDARTRATRGAIWPVILCAFALASLFWRLDYARFWNPDEGRYAAASLEMAHPLVGEATDWLVPHLDTVARLNKPPLVYWLAATAFRLLGASEVSARLIPTLAALAVGLVLLSWGNRAFGAPAGLFSAAVWATMALPAALGRVLNTDMLLCASLTLAFYAGWRALECRDEPNWPWWLVLGTAMGLGCLTKGPVAVVLPLAGAAAFLIVVRGPRDQGTGRQVAGLGLASFLGVILSAPWYLAVNARYPDFFRRFFLTENLARFSGGHEFHTSNPFWFYLPVILAGALPWTGLLLLGAAPWPRNDTEARSRTYGCACAGAVVLLFSLSGTKLFTYVLPAMPMLALLLGTACARWATLTPRWTRAAAWGLTIQNLVLVVVLIKVAHAGRIAPPSLMHRALILPLICLVAMTLLTWWGRTGAGVPTAPLGMGLTAAFLTMGLVSATSRLAPYHEPGALLVAAERFAPVAPVVCYRTFLPSTIFYSRQPATFLDFLNTSGLEERQVAQSPWFRPSRPGALASQMPPGALLLARAELPPAQGAGLRLWGRNNLFWLYSAAPKPAGLTADFVSRPTKRGVTAF